MTSTITLDKAGRVLIPKSLRKALLLSAGDVLQLESHGDEIRLRPVRPEALLKQEKGVWVYQGQPTHASLPDLIDQERQQRMRQMLE